MNRLVSISLLMTMNKLIDDCENAYFDSFFIEVGHSLMNNTTI